MMKTLLLLAGLYLVLASAGTQTVQAGHPGGNCLTPIVVSN